MLLLIYSYCNYESLQPPFELHGVLRACYCVVYNVGVDLVGEPTIGGEGKGNGRRGIISCNSSAVVYCTVYNYYAGAGYKWGGGGGVTARGRR